MPDFRNVYFSFHYDDAVPAAQVRNSDVCNKGKSFNDWADWETIRRSDDATIRRWIREQMAGTSVTVVLIGAETAQRPWVKFEIEESIREEKGLLGIYIDQLIGFHGVHRYPRLRGPNPFLQFPRRAETERRKRSYGLATMAMSMGISQQRPQPGIIDGARAASYGLRGMVSPPRSAATLLTGGLMGLGSLANQVECYCWRADNGFVNIGDWIQKAARDVGR